MFWPLSTPWDDPPLCVEFVPGVVDTWSSRRPTPGTRLSSGTDGVTTWWPSTGGPGASRHGFATRVILRGKPRSSESGGGPGGHKTPGRHTVRALWGRIMMAVEGSGETASRKHWENYHRPSRPKCWAEEPAGGGPLHELSSLTLQERLQVLQNFTSTSATVHIKQQSRNTYFKDTLQEVKDINSLKIQ